MNDSAMIPLKKKAMATTMRMDSCLAPEASATALADSLDDDDLYTFTETLNRLALRHAL